MGEKTEIFVLTDLEADEFAALEAVTCFRCFALSAVWMTGGRAKQPCYVCDGLIAVRTIEA